VTASNTYLSLTAPATGFNQPQASGSTAYGPI